MELSERIARAVWDNDVIRRNDEEDFLRRVVPVIDRYLQSQWQPIESAPRDGSAFRAYGPNLIHPDFNPWGQVEAVFDGEQFIGAVWDGQFDCWNTMPIQFTHWSKMPPSPEVQR